MPSITSALSLPQPTVLATPARPVAAPPAPAAAATAPAAPSTTVTLSPQAQSALAAASQPGTLPTATSASAPAPSHATHDGSMYESLKNGISTAAADVGNAIAGGAHAVVDGVGTALSTANSAVKGTLGLPFAAVAKACDAVGSLIDEL